MVDSFSFVARTKEANRRILQMRDPLLLHHLDADGITSAAIVSAGLQRAGIPFNRLLLKRLDESVLEQLARSQSSKKEFIFTDLGSTMCKDLSRIMKNSDVVILDHHPPQAPAEELPSNVWMANCHYDGFSGATDACSATTAYFTFREHKDLGEIGIVGAIADVQDKAGEGFSGLNRLMLEDASSAGVVEVKKDLRIFGRASRPLVWFLSYCNEPELPGLSGDEKACARFLEANNIPYQQEGKWLTYYDLGEEKRKDLTSALIAHCYENGVDEEAITNLIGDVYLLKKEPEHTELSDATEFSVMINACGRHGQPDLGVALCLHEPGAYEQAKELLKIHRGLLAQSIQFAKERAQDLGAFYFLDGRGTISDTIVGTVAGAYYNSGSFPKDKPIIAFSLDENGAVKASGRACKHLVESGLNLGQVMERAAAAAGGSGAGHDIAAGAAFPAGHEKMFLETAKRVIQAQLTK